LVPINSSPIHTYRKYYCLTMSLTFLVKEVWQKAKLFCGFFGGVDM